MKFLTRKYSLLHLDNFYWLSIFWHWWYKVWFNTRTSTCCWVAGWCRDSLLEITWLLCPSISTNLPQSKSSAALESLHNFSWSLLSLFPMRLDWFSQLLMLVRLPSLDWWWESMQSSSYCNQYCFWLTMFLKVLTLLLLKIKMNKPEKWLVSSLFPNLSRRPIDKSRHRFRLSCTLKTVRNHKWRFNTVLRPSCSVFSCLSCSRWRASMLLSLKQQLLLRE